jgi:hypothetical protein
MWPNKCISEVPKLWRAEKIPKEIMVTKNPNLAGHCWLTPEIPATQEAEIRRIMVQGYPGQIVCEILS